MIGDKENSTDRINIAVIVTDKDRKIQWVNEDFTQITGYTLQDVLGKKPSILHGKNTEPYIVEEIRSSLNQLIPIKTDITNYRKDGEEYTCKLVIYPIFDEEGSHTNFIAFEIDGDKIADDSNISLLQLEPRYCTSSLTDTKGLDIFIKLNALFENERIYLQPDLKLKDLANKLGTNTRYLSQVVNDRTGRNMLNFINKYRVEAAKKRVRDSSYSHLTTFAISQMCGFRNKSTFYKVFKEFEGMTPKHFVRNLDKISTTIN
jgi:PAS domain S-box-containing protein